MSAHILSLISTILAFLSTAATAFIFVVYRKAEVENYNLRRTAESYEIVNKALEKENIALKLHCQL